MNDDDNFELDSELAKSIEKLVDEETSVAKAFVDRNALKEDAAVSSQMSPSDDMTKTRTIPDLPSRQIKLDDNIDMDHNTLLDEETEATVPESAENGDGAPAPKKKLDKKTKLIIAGISAAVVLVIATIIIVAVIMNNKNKNSYDYNYAKGMEYYNSKNHESARPYLEKASTTSEGRKNVNLKSSLYDCYVAANDNDKAVEMLKDILSYEKNNEKALTALAAYYASTKDGDKLTELIRNYKGTDGAKYLTGYTVTAPTASKEAGNYDKAVELELTADNSNEIYYTLDGTDPTADSQQYLEAISLQKGDTTVKAIAVNTIGTASDIVEMKFVIAYKAPDAPELSPTAGKTYEEGQKISITNLKDGDTAYYTIDGSAPTTASTRYTGEFNMPVGNSVVSAIIVNEYDLESAVTKKNYIVTASKTYTFDEAKEKLKARMIAKGDMTAAGTTSGGKTITFVFDIKTTVNNVEMYITYYDIGGVRQSDYFGIDVKSGNCYRVSGGSGTFTATAY